MMGLHVRKFTENPFRCICTGILLNKAQISERNIYSIDINESKSIVLLQLLPLCWTCSNDMHSKNFIVLIKSYNFLVSLQYVGFS